MQIYFILCFSWSTLAKLCVHLQTSSSKTQMLLLEKTIFQKYWRFCERFFAFTFDLCGLLSLVCHSWTIAKTMYLLRRQISTSDRIPDRFYVISMEFLLLSRRCSSTRNVPSDEEQEARNGCFRRLKTTFCKIKYVIPYSFYIE